MRAITSDSCIPSDTERQRVPKPARRGLSGRSTIRGSERSPIMAVPQSKASINPITVARQMGPASGDTPFEPRTAYLRSNTITCSKRFPLASVPQTLVVSVLPSTET